MNTTGSTSTALETIAQYVEATRTGDVEKMRGVFTTAALMWGFSEGEFYIGSPECFFDELRDNPSPSIVSKAYSDE